MPSAPRFSHAWTRWAKRWRTTARSILFADEGPEVRVYLAAFAVDRVSEVSVAAYRLCAAAGVLLPRARWRRPTRFGQERLADHVGDLERKADSPIVGGATRDCRPRPSGSAPLAAPMGARGRGAMCRTSGASTTGASCRPAEQGRIPLLRLWPDASDGNAFLAKVGSYPSGSSRPSGRSTWRAMSRSGPPPITTPRQIAAVADHRQSARTVVGDAARGAWRLVAQESPVFARTTSRQGLDPGDARLRSGISLCEVGATKMTKLELLDQIRQERTDRIFDLLRLPEWRAALDEGHVKVRLQWLVYYNDVTALKAVLEAGGDLGKASTSTCRLQPRGVLRALERCATFSSHGADAKTATTESGETPLHAALAMAMVALTILYVVAAARPRTRRERLNARTIPTRRAPARSCATCAPRARRRSIQRTAAYADALTIQFLLEHGADKEARDANGDSPLSWASEHLRPGSHPGAPDVRHAHHRRQRAALHHQRSRSGMGKRHGAKATRRISARELARSVCRPVARSRRTHAAAASSRSAHARQIEARLGERGLWIEEIRRRRATRLHLRVGHRDRPLPRWRSSLAPASRRCARRSSAKARWPPR